MSEEIRVEMAHDDGAVLVGTAYFHVARGHISTTFRYSDDYLSSPWAYPIDPFLPLSAAPFSVPGLPGCFSDCAPDRWGRNLVAKQHRRLVGEGIARDRRLTDVDYLLGVSDETRQGALRFRHSIAEEYLGSGTHIPKLLSLPELQQAADDAAEGSDVAIKRLLEAGTGSLGGARPKASVLGDDGTLMIAKFSRETDDWNVIAWEALSLRLAQSAGISVPVNRLLTIDERPVLLLQRFDRTGNRRHGFISAMTAAGRRDGEPADYLDVVEAIEDLSGRWRRDCEALFRRLVFSVATHNTDDHLRNHGFVRTESGWELSPAFDINPEPSLAVDRQTAINGVTEADDEAEALLEFAGLCHLTIPAARTVMVDVAEAVGQWRQHAAALPITSTDLDRMSSAIETQVDRVKSAAGA